MSLYDFRDQLKHSLEWYSARLEKLQKDEEGKLSSLSKEVISDELTKLNGYTKSLDEFFEGNIGPEPRKVFKSALEAYSRFLEKNKKHLTKVFPGLDVKKLEKELEDIPRIIDIMNKKEA